jgi:hypothetical protein
MKMGASVSPNSAAARNSVATFGAATKPGSTGGEQTERPHQALPGWSAPPAGAVPQAAERTAQGHGGEDPAAGGGRVAALGEVDDREFDGNGGRGDQDERRKQGRGAGAGQHGPHCGPKSAG